MDKDITAYAVSVDAIYANGRKDHSEKMEDYGPFLASKREVLHPGHTSDQPDSWAVMPTNPLRTVEVKVVSVVYSDQAADVQDEGAFQRIVEHRTSVARALQKSADIIKSALADTTNEHPSAKAANDIKELLYQAKVSHSTDTDKAYLQGTSDELQKAPLKSAERGISERSYLTERLAQLQEEVAIHEKYAQIRRTQ